MNRKKKATSRKLAVGLNISRTSVRRILKYDLLIQPHKKIIEPLLTDEHKEKRKQFSNWVRRGFRKEDTVPRMRNCSTQMGSTTVKMIVYGQSAESKLIKEVA